MVTPLTGAPTVMVPTIELAGQVGDPKEAAVPVPLVETPGAAPTVATPEPLGVVLVIQVKGPAEVGVPDVKRVTSWQPVDVKVPAPKKVTPFSTARRLYEPMVVTLA